MALVHSPRGGCLSGIPHPTNQVCCNASCGSCGGRGCSGRPGGPFQCCMPAILRARRRCRSTTDVACILQGGAIDDLARPGENLTLAQRANGSRSTASFWLSAASGYRPARLAPAQQMQQRIPRHIVQVGSTFEWASRGRYSAYMAGWWTRNPDYAYAFFNDSHARHYVTRRASENESSAYLSLKHGAQRADLFRMIWIKYEGGVYADLDSSCIRPLSSVIEPHYSAYVGPSWSFEFLAYEPGHPIIVAGLNRQVANVLRQVALLNQPAQDRTGLCRGAHSCVVSQTGPSAYWAGVWEATHRLGCTNQRQLFTAGQCSSSVSDPMRRVHVCRRISYIGSGMLGRIMTCNVSRHNDCRNGGILGLRCGSSRSNSPHYTRIGVDAERFFATAPLLR